MKLFTQLFFVAIIFAGVAFIHKQQEKKYPVFYTKDQWIQKLQILDNAKEVMRKSSLPGTVISQWQDSLSSFQADINQQVGNKIAEDSSAKTKKN